MKLRRLLKPLGFLGVGLLYLTGLSGVGLMLLLTNPLTDSRLPLRPLFDVWPFVMVVGITFLIWWRREPVAWWLAVAIGVTPLVAIALIAAGIAR